MQDEDRLISVLLYPIQLYLLEKLSGKDSLSVYRRLFQRNAYPNKSQCATINTNRNTPKNKRVIESPNVVNELKLQTLQTIYGPIFSKDKKSEENVAVTCRAKEEQEE